MVDQDVKEKTIRLLETLVSVIANTIIVFICYGHLNRAFNLPDFTLFDTFVLLLFVRNILPHWGRRIEG